MKGVLLLIGLLHLIHYGFGSMLPMPQFPEDCVHHVEGKKCWTLLLKPDNEECPNSVNAMSGEFYFSTSKHLCANQVKLKVSTN